MGVYYKVIYNPDTAWYPLCLGKEGCDGRYGHVQKKLHVQAYGAHPWRFAGESQGVEGRQTKDKGFTWAT